MGEQEYQRLKRRGDLLIVFVISAVALLSMAGALPWRAQPATVQDLDMLWLFIAALWLRKRAY